MMKEMKNSGIDWIGEVPADWEIMPLKYKCTLNAETLGEDTDPNYEFNYVEIGSVSLEKGIYKYEKTTFGNCPSRARRIVRKNDIIISTVRTYLKAIAVVPDKEDLIVSTGFAVIKPENISPEYLGYMLKTDYFTNSVSAKSVGVSYPAINASDLVSFKILVPPTREQQKIADFLDSKVSEIDKVIAETKSSIENYKEYKQSVITEAVTKGLNKDVQMKDTDSEWIGQIPADWNVSKLRYLVNKIGDIDHYMPETTSEGYPYIMTGDLKPTVSIIDFDKCKKVSKSDYDLLSEKMKSEVGDVILARYATIGTVCYVDIDKDFLVSYSCVTIKPNKKLNGKYLFYFSKSKAFEEEIKKYINANTQGNVGIDSLYRVKVSLPNINEQQIIIDYLDAKTAEIDKLISEKEALVSNLEEYKKSLIYEYVTGKKAVL